MSTSATRQKVRCAIYTRKSSEEGLEQEFNSLDAQREACEAYIKSQRHEGWIVIPALYDDPAFSGGNMDRPALKRLLADIDAGRIDTVVVYKVDRLTRALADFAKIVEAFDARGVTFVSVTQAFNTTTSMGRLTLNVLLSFAQFEREVTGERIRDKIAASKKKGMWMGGLPPLGFDVRDRKLVVNEAEAETVRHIFNRYCALGSVRALAQELETGKIFSKVRTAADGTSYGGKSFSRGALYQLLQNKIYIGLTTHKGQSYPGEHEAIVDDDLWESTQTLLDSNRVERRSLTGSAQILTGLIFGASGEAMTPSHASKKGIRYCYYISRTLTKNCKRDYPEGQRIPANLLEDLVLNRIKDFLNKPEDLLHALPASFQGATFQSRLNDRSREILDAIEKDPARGWKHMIRQFINRIQVHRDHVEIEVNKNDLARMIFGDREYSSAVEHDPEHTVMAIRVDATLKRTGKELKFIIQGAVDNTAPDQSLIRLLGRARSIQDAIESSVSASIEEIASLQNITPSYAARLMRLNYLAPDIVEAIIAGRQPAGLSANKLIKDTRFPLGWHEQHIVLGFEQNRPH
jgi:DNA invertase Pin-like site-specific DNA recombinase